ncbi:MAG: Uncharacterised protein [Owenweeksia sp. TMED14]|nr:MAG: Uncharacterised protein [Owenweeksia sp. TMED14]
MPPKKKIKPKTHTMVIDGNLVEMSGAKHTKSSKIIRIISKAKKGSKSSY